MKTLIVIPARMKATRLPNKPLAMITGEPMIVHVWRRAVEAGVGDVIVACDGEEIAQAVRAVGGVAVITDPDHPSGSDRIWEAVQKSETRNQKPETRNQKPDIIINLQGDVPTLEPRLLRELLRPLENPAVDIATLAARITRTEEHDNPAVVKVVLAELSDDSDARSVAPSPLRGGLGRGAADSSQPISPPPTESPPLIPPVNGGDKGGLSTPPQGGSIPVAPPSPCFIARALYFSRAPIPYGDGPRYHHIGVYAYRYEALKRFVSLPPSPLELREKLEQLRALEAGMRIDAVVVDTVPLGVDTPEDLARARGMLKA